MLEIEHSVREVTVAAPGRLPAAVPESAEPVVLRGLVAHWPMVVAARESDEDALAYLRQAWRGATVGAFFGPPGIGGRIFYNEDFSGFNFERIKIKLDELLERIRQHREDAHPPTLYMGSTTVDTCLPGFRADNDVDLDAIEPLASIWLGNRSRIAAHYDVPDNLACCAAGRRRVILFPPEELENLYVGPLDFTPAGQAISLVDFANPDPERYPRFRRALRRAQCAELGPGDALFIPGLWWHHVEALDPLNVLVNYWWRGVPGYMGQPRDVLTHALLSLRDLPPAQRSAWRRIFDFYVFGFEEEAVAHIPAQRRGILAPIDDTTARRIRAALLNRLNR